MSHTLQGHLLIATPSLNDPNFFKAIVLIVQHSEEGALGLVLNRATKTSIKQVWQQVKETTCPVEDSLYLGGPVEGPLVAIHTCEPEADLEIMNGLYYSVQPDHLERLMAEAQQPIRFIAGYSGWGPGQLESEIEQGAWNISAATLDLVFAPDARKWEKLARSLADQQLTKLLKVKHVPGNPSLN